MEATTTAVELVHEVATVTDGFDHRAECSCGWASEWLVDDVAAVQAGVEHPEVAVGRPDALDRFMSGLLDVQDDLAQVVVWMAENWSAGLPVPTRRSLDLTVECQAAGELAGVAAVMGADVQHDPRHDTGEATYRCARRQFGTVVFEAWRYER